MLCSSGRIATCFCAQRPNVTSALVRACGTPVCSVVQASTFATWMKQSGHKFKSPNKSDLPSKVCVVCNRPFTWRKKWEKCWDEVKYCSERCRRSGKSSALQPPPAVSAAGETASLSAAAESTQDSSAAGSMAQHNGLRHAYTGAEQVLGEAADATCQDVGNIVHFEHLNLEVPDVEVARVFYAEGLGLVADPGSKAGQRGGIGVQWYNIGRQQFHIARGPAAQHTSLPVTLVIPGTLDSLLRRLRFVQPHLQQTQFACEHVAPSSSNGQATGISSGRSGNNGSHQKAEGGSSRSHPEAGVEHVAVTDPWGQRFTVLDGVGAAAAGLIAEPGIRRVRLVCHRCTAAAIGAFYETMLKARVEVPRPELAVVHMGPGSTLTFEEDALELEGSLPNDDTGRADKLAELIDDGGSWHIAFYLADFSSAYAAVRAAGLNLLDHPYRDKANTLQDALNWSQFRMGEVAVVESCVPKGFSVGDRLHRFGHEIRSLHHPRYMRSLYNIGVNAYDDHGPLLV